MSLLLHLVSVLQCLLPGSCFSLDHCVCVFVCFCCCDIIVLHLSFEESSCPFVIYFVTNTSESAVHRDTTSCPRLCFDIFTYILRIWKILFFFQNLIERFVKSWSLSSPTNQLYRSWRPYWPLVAPAGSIYKQNKESVKREWEEVANINADQYTKHWLLYLYNSFVYIGIDFSAYFNFEL